MRINFKGKKVLVYGLGISGQSACKLLHEKGACVSVYDDEKRFGTFFPFVENPLTKKYDYVVLSPGVKVLGNTIISHFILSRTKVLSELDLGWLFFEGKIVGITGTNGKTTTTSLVGEIFKAAGNPRLTQMINNLAEQMYRLCVEVAPHLFKHAGPPCAYGACPEGKMSCGKAAEVRAHYRAIMEKKEN